MAYAFTHDNITRKSTDKKLKQITYVWIRNTTNNTNMYDKDNNKLQETSVCEN